MSEQATRPNVIELELQPPARARAARERLVSQGYNPCGIDGCACLWLRGGVLNPKPLCPRHYHRQRRESPNAECGASIERRDAFTIRPLPELAELIRKEQRKLKGSVSDAVNALLAELLVYRSETATRAGFRPRKRAAAAPVP